MQEIDPEGQIRDARSLAPWPEGQRVVAPDAERSYLVTHFDDHAAYAPELVLLLTDMAGRSPWREQYGRHLGGTKLYHPESWHSRWGGFLNERALAFYRRVSGREDGYVQLAWANLYRAGDWIVPHSHTEADISLVYLLDAGDEVGENSTSGRFCVADPRLPLCCRVEPTRLTNSIAPKLRPGSLVLFAAETVHYVHPYEGQRPRLTISWNIRHGRPAA